MRKIISIVLMMVVAVVSVSAIPLPKNADAETKAMSRRLFGKEIVPMYDCIVDGELLPYYVGYGDVYIVKHTFINIAKKQAGRKFEEHWSYYENNTGLNKDVEAITREYGSSCTIYFNYMGQYVIVVNTLSSYDDTISTEVFEWY